MTNLDHSKIQCIQNFIEIEINSVRTFRSLESKRLNLEVKPRLFLKQNRELASRKFPLSAQLPFKGFLSREILKLMLYFSH